MERRFRKFGGEMVNDLGLYVKNHIEKYPGETIYVGCDSDVRKNGRKIMYADIVAFYNNERGEGVHYVFNRELVKGIPVKKIYTGNKSADKKAYRKALTSAIFQRIWAEVERLEEIGEYLESELDGIYPRMTPEEAVERGYKANQTKLVDLDLDVNPTPGWTPYQRELIRMGQEPGIPRNRSYIVYEAAKSYLEGKGYRVRYKPDSWASKCCADLICKGGKS